MFFSSVFSQRLPDPLLVTWLELYREAGSRMPFGVSDEHDSLHYIENIPASKEDSTGVPACFIADQWQSPWASFPCLDPCFPAAWQRDSFGWLGSCFGSICTIVGLAPSPAPSRLLTPVSRQICQQITPHPDRWIYFQVSRWVGAVLIFVSWQCGP